MKIIYQMTRQDPAEKMRQASGRETDEKQASGKIRGDLSVYMTATC